MRETGRASWRQGNRAERTPGRFSLLTKCRPDGRNGAIPLVRRGAKVGRVHVLGGGSGAVRDRRAAQRFILTVPVSVWGISGKPIDGTVCDLSPAGVRFQAEAPFREGNSLGIVLMLPPNPSGNMMYVWACGKVVRVDAEGGGRKNRVCVSFLSVKYDLCRAPSAAGA